MEKLTLELSLEAWVKLGVEGQRGISHWRCVFLSRPAHPSDPSILMVAVMLILTLRLPMVCGVLILGTEHPASMADFSTELMGFCGVPGADMADFKTSTPSRAVVDSSGVLRVEAAGEA